MLLGQVLHVHVVREVVRIPREAVLGTVPPHGQAEAAHEPLLEEAHGHPCLPVPLPEHRQAGLGGALERARLL